MIECPNCGAMNPDEATFCGLCFETMGFETPGYAIGRRFGDGYLRSYPSSFKEEGMPAEDHDAYREDTAFSLEETKHAGFPASTTVGAGFSSSLGKPAREKPGALKPFSLEKGISVALRVAVLAALISLLMEWLFDSLGLGAFFREDLPLSRFYLLLPLIIPACLCGYLTGLRLEQKGVIFGIVSAVFWALLFRPLYNSVLRWIYTGSFTFSAIFSAMNVAFTLGLYIPAAALLGLIGEKRATRGLGI